MNRLEGFHFGNVWLASYYDIAKGGWIRNQAKVRPSNVLWFQKFRFDFAGGTLSFKKSKGVKKNPRVFKKVWHT
jgi:hypothetical protein